MKLSILQALCTCLGAPDPEVLVEVLKTLVSYVRRSHTSSIRFQGYQALSNRLTALASGWGGKEEVEPHCSKPGCYHFGLMGSAALALSCQNVANGRGIGCWPVCLHSGTQPVGAYCCKPHRASLLQTSPA